MHAKRKINKEIEERFVSDSGYTSHMVNIIKNMKNIGEVKTVVNIGNKEMMTGSF